MGAKLGLFIGGRWRSLRSLQAEGVPLSFFVVRGGIIKELAWPPRRSQVVAGPPLPFRKIKRFKDKHRKRQQPLTDIEINNKYSKSIPVITQNFKAFKSFPDTKLQKAYKSIPEHHNNNVQEKGVVINNTSKAESLKLTEKENIPKKDAKNNRQLSLTKKGYKNLKPALINNNDDILTNSRENTEKENILKEDFKKNQQSSTSKGSKKNLKSSLIINGNDDKLTKGKENVEKEKIPLQDFKKSQQSSTGKGSNKNVGSSLISSNDNLRNAEQKLEKESSKTKDIYKDAQPSTSKGSNQDLRSPSSPTNKNDKLRNHEDSAVESDSSGPFLELDVEPEDLKMMHKCLTKEPIFKVDNDRFEKDESYQQRVLYKLQPFVRVSCLKPGLHHQLSVSATRKGKLASGSSLKKKDKSSTTTVNKRRRSPVRFRKSSVPPGREYSSLEDHAIVSWLSASRTREHAVNGNRVWKELQPHHARLTGQDRSWHSLRNRYLRYILPALGRLALSPSHAQRLRAAAATGEIKSRKKRRPSILHEPPVHTAHQRACVRPSIVPTDSESDGILHHKVQRPSLRHKSKKDARSPLKQQRTEPRKDAAEDSSDDEAKLPKTTPSKKPRGSEESDSDDAPLELSRLRPRPPLNLSDASDNDNTYDPSPKKKRRRLFNP